MRQLLKAGLKRLVATSPRHELGTRRARVLAVASQKGGVGKTTTSVNLAAALARFHDQRVLVVDLDPQGHVAVALRRSVRSGGGPLSRVLAAEGGEVLDAAASTDIAALDVTPFDPALGTAEDLLGTRIGKELVLREAMVATRTHYDVIVLDCPPNLGNLSLNGLVAADLVLIPCDPSPLALQGAEGLVRTIHQVAARLNPEIDVLGVLLTRVDGRNTTMNRGIRDQLARTWGDALIPVEIGISSGLAQAQEAGVDIFAHDVNARGAQQYAALADWVMGALAR